MSNEIKTIEEARKKTYGFPFSPRAYKEGFCAAIVNSPRRGSTPLQCHRANGYGIGGLYCKGHAKEHPSEETLAEVFTAYKANHCRLNNWIDEVQCSNMTAGQVTVKSLNGGWITERLVDDGGFGYRYFTNRNEAITYLRDYMQQRVDTAQKEVEALKRRLESIK